MRRLSNALLLRFLLVPTGLFPYYCCLAGRSPSPRRDGSSFSPLGRFDLTTDRFPLLSFFQKSTTASTTVTTSNNNNNNDIINNKNKVHNSGPVHPRRISWNKLPTDDRRSNCDHLEDDLPTRTTLRDENSPPPIQERTREATAHPAVIFKRRPLRTDEQATAVASTAATTTNTRHELALQLSQPLIPQEAWDRMMMMMTSRGDEEKDGDLLGEDEEAVEALTKSGLQLCRAATMTTSPTIDGHHAKQKNLVEWVPHSSTTKVLDDHGQNKEAALKEGNVLVYVGTILQENVVGGGLPMIKTESILPMAARDMANLLMDSSKVPIYNKMSLGRTDVKIIQNKNNKDPTSPVFSITKIVRNITRPPLAQSSMVSVTLMHSRQLRDDDHLVSTDGFVVVSRAVPGMVGEEFQEMPRNDILMGVNVLQDRRIAPPASNEHQQQPPDECFMTAVTHVYSPALPKLLAKSMGVTSAVNFVRDIRESCRPPL